MPSFFDDVGEFHRRFGLPHVGDGTEPHLLDPDTFEFRLRFIQEELRELVNAHERGDLAGFLDALIDLSYVIKGTAHLAHLPFNEGWAEVQRTNLAKERAAGADDPRSKRAHRFDVVKPVGWQPPDLERVIRDYVYVYLRTDAAE